MRTFKREKSLGDTFNIESIRLRLLFIMLGLMIVSLSLLTGLSYYFSDQALSKSVRKTAQAIGQDYSKRASAFVGELVIYVEAVAVNPHIVNPGNRQEIVDELAGALARNTKFTGINYGDLDGNMIRAQGDTAYLGDRDYYRKAVQTKTLVISEPLVSKGSGRLSIAIAVPVLENGEVRAIIQATMPLDSLTEMVQDIKFMDSGYGFLVDKSGVVLAHALRPELNGKVNLSEAANNPALAKDLIETDERMVALFKKAVNSRQSIQGTYNIDHNPIFTVFTPVELAGDAHWLMAVSAPASEVTSAVSQLNAILIVAALVCIAGGVLVIFLISRRFARPEEKYFKAFRHVGDAIGIVNIGSEKFIEANDAFFKILGYCREEVIGCRSEAFGLWSKDGKQEIYAALKQGKSVYNRETVWQTKDQKIKIGLLSADAIQIGNEQYAVFIWHDITAQKEAERALRQAYGEMEQKVEERTQELFAANQELTAMNEEMIAVNEELERSNTALHEENHSRRQAESKLLLRERQYRATTSLLTRPADETDPLVKTVLRNAVELVEATAGFIGMYSADGVDFAIHYGIGFHEQSFFKEQRVTDGPLKQVYETGEVFQLQDDCPHNLQEGKEKTAAMLFVPLKQQDKVKGVLAASWSGARHEIDEEDVGVLQQFADLAFLAIEREQTQAKIQHTAFYDVLTDLPNRVSLHLRLEEELQAARRGRAEGILLFIDMDDLKAVNDTFGHSAGDQVIVAAGNSLRAAFAEEAFVSRISGDEFIVIVPGRAAVEKAAEIANGVLRQLCHDYSVAQEQIQMSASIGLVAYPQDGNRVEDLLKKADAAMYAAKEAGRNCWRSFEPVLLQKTTADMKMINDLRRGLARGEFFLLYQPQLTVDGRRIIGFEALLRWQSDVHGLVSPGRFIPLAERSRLILEIGQWVLAQACQFAKRLENMGWKNIYIAVNISPRQIRDEGFVQAVREIIAANGACPEQIEFEVTESVLMDNLEDSVGKLAALQDGGSSLALDDFGTGYSSLTYLRTLPVNCLKIDKSFIDKIAADEMQWQLVKSIIHMGHTLGMKIVAEGVETVEQLDKLAACGCDYVQGFVFSRAVAAQEAIELLREQKNGG